METKINFDEKYRANQAQLREWVELWATTMVEIWKAKIRALSSERVWWAPNPIYDNRTPPQRHTWRHLQETPQVQGIVWNDPNEPMAGFTIMHTFALYGVWVDAGVGGEMRPSEKGGMVRNERGQFLPNQKGMRQKTRGPLGKWEPKRKARHWYSTSYYRSCQKMLAKVQNDMPANFTLLMYDLQRTLSFARVNRMAHKELYGNE